MILDSSVKTVSVPAIVICAWKVPMRNASMARAGNRSDQTETWLQAELGHRIAFYQKYSTESQLSNSELC